MLRTADVRSMARAIRREAGKGRGNYCTAREFCSIKTLYKYIQFQPGTHSLSFLSMRASHTYVGHCRLHEINVLSFLSPRRLASLTREIF